MKSLVFVLSVFVSLNVLASDLASCVLTQKHYSSVNNKDYIFEMKEVLSNEEAQMYDGVELKGQGGYASYAVTFSPSEKIEGALFFQIDQPGPTTYGSVVIHDTLTLTYEDYYNGGKGEYTLVCKTL